MNLFTVIKRWIANVLKYFVRIQIIFVKNIVYF
jgi:hypothetical protein